MNKIEEKRRYKHKKNLLGIIKKIIKIHDKISYWHFIVFGIGIFLMRVVFYSTVKEEPIYCMTLGAGLYSMYLLIRDQIFASVFIEKLEKKLFKKENI